MSDLRTAAQAVIDIWNDPSLAIEPAIESLRQALDAPVEPVGKKLTREELSHTDGRIEFVWWKDIPHGAFIYTTPPSVDALIGVDELANIIRAADGNHSLGAGALAEKIIEAIRARGQK